MFRCVDCGHEAWVLAGSKLWCCAACELIQRPDREPGDSEPDEDAPSLAERGVCVIEYGTNAKGYAS